MLTLCLLLALLPAEARRLNKEAMVHYDAGRLDEAFELFAAAYDSIPEDREHHRDRNDLAGSMLAALLQEHERTGAAAPLCKLRDMLQQHIISLRMIFDGEQEQQEVDHIFRAIGSVDGKLAAYPAKVCDPEPPPAAPTPPAPAPAPLVAPAPAPAAAPVSSPDQPEPARRPLLRGAGTALIGGGAALLGAMTVGIAMHARTTDRLDTRARDLPPARRIDAVTWTVMHEDLERARLQRGLAIGAGISGALLVGSGVALLLVGRARHDRQVALAPWWLSSGTGLTVRVRLP